MQGKLEKVLDRTMYDSIYENELPNSQFYIDYYKTLPSMNGFYMTVNKDIEEVFLKQGFKILMLNEDNSYDNSNPARNKFIKKLLLNDLKEILITLSYYQFKNDHFTCSVKIFYDNQKGEINKQLDLSEIKNYVFKNDTSNIKLIKNDNGYIDIENFNLETPVMDLELNYGAEFAKKHNIILESLKKSNSKGIVLLHGEAGTGKTTYIKYLTSLIKNKNVLFVPPSMVDVLSDPSIIPFLIQNSNSILLIEDGEKVIADRETNPSYAAGVSNLLNMTDGILGDCLNIQVIVTFNMEREKIDNALLRNGRLISEHKFNALNPNDSNKLLKHLGKKYKTEKPMSLADIYNVDDITYLEKKRKTTIGFKD